MAKKSEWDEFEKTQQFNLRISPEFLKSVDEWRRHQDDIPNRSESLRRLAEIGLEVEASKAERRSRK